MYKSDNSKFITKFKDLTYYIEVNLDTLFELDNPDTPDRIEKCEKDHLLVYYNVAERANIIGSKSLYNYHFKTQEDMLLFKLKYNL
jgi:hypothetical protein